MTPAITLLKKKRIHHEVLKYEHDSNAPSFGLEAVEKLGLAAECVFKTLVVSTEREELAVVVVPVATKLSEKKVAKALGAKKVSMAKAEAVVASTGYILGGVSPIAQKKRLSTLIDTSAKQFTSVYVSAGKRGLEVALSPSDLAELTQGKFADVSV